MTKSCISNLHHNRVTNQSKTNVPSNSMPHFKSARFVRETPAPTMMPYVFSKTTTGTILDIKDQGSMQVRDGKSTIESGKWTDLNEKRKVSVQTLYFRWIGAKNGFGWPSAVGAEPVCRQQPYEAMMVAWLRRFKLSRRVGKTPFDVNPSMWWIEIPLVKMIMFCACKSYHQRKFSWETSDIRTTSQ